MTSAEIKDTLAVRGCSIVGHGGKFALVFPYGIERATRSHELLATSDDAALVEAWLWLHQEHLTNSASVLTIQRVVCTHYRQMTTAMMSRDRHEPLATARLVAMALAHVLTACPMTVIAELFNRSEHSTINYAVQTVANRCETDKQFAAHVGMLRVECEAALLKEAA